MSSEGVPLFEGLNNRLFNAVVSTCRDLDNVTRERLTLRHRRKSSKESRTKQPLVSVYIPTHNRVNLLMERALPSVLSQSYDNLEVLVVADRCSDNTVDAVRDLRDPRVVVHYIDGYTPRYPPTVENIWLCGPVTAANKALNCVSGQWVARIDDDDMWTERHIERCLEVAQENGAEFISTSYLAERHGERYVCRGDSWKGVQIGGTQTWVYKSYLTLFKYSNQCWRRRSERVNDLDLQRRMLRAGVRMTFLDEVHALVLPRPGSATIGLDQYMADQDGIRNWFSVD